MAESSVPDTTKLCRYCRQMKSKDEFEQKPLRTRWGTDTVRCTETCLDCVGQGRYHPPKTEKCCIFCNEVKPVTAFHSHNYTTRTGKSSRRLMSGCKECCSKYQRIRRVEKKDEIAEQSREYRERNRPRLIEKSKEYYAANKARMVASQRKHHLRTNYGLTPEQHDGMIAGQNGKCLICGEKPTQVGSKKGLHVDHCHDTGRVRGLLCHNCNCAMGLLKEDPIRIQAMLDYILKHSLRCRV